MKVTAITISFLVLAGCSGPWGKFYRPVSQGNFSSSAAVQVREVPPERFLQYSAQARQRNAMSSVALADRSPYAQIQDRNEFLEMLQLPQRGGEAQLIGYSDFVYPTAVDPNNGQLERFARSIGADYAIWTAVDAGLYQRIQMVPSYSTAVASDGYSTITASGYSSRGVVVTERRLEYVAYYIRVFARHN